MASSYVSVTEELFFNNQSRRSRQHQSSNEIWQLSIQRYVFYNFLVINALRMCFKMFYLQMMSARATS